MSVKSKVYEEVLNEIQLFIKNNGLTPGDRLPSERELSERLNAARSSVREALRALELLGLIETRHGEGTFLRSYRPYHMVELLSAFILQEPTTRHNILEAKRMMEKEATKLAILHPNNNIDTDKLLLIIDNDKLDDRKKHMEFFTIIFHYANNSLINRIWVLMEEFSHTFEGTTFDKHFYVRLVDLLKSKQYEKIDSLFNNLK